MTILLIAYRETSVSYTHLDVYKRQDPTSDPISEVIYIRDEEDGRIWSPTGLPIRDQGKYSIHHGWGYSEFYHDSHGINQNLIMYVPLEESIKINLLKLHNHSCLLYTSRCV